MSGTKHKASVQDVRALVNKYWPNVIVVGSTPYNKGLQMIDPITWQILEDFPKNWDAYSRIVTHGITKWFPGKDKEGVLFTREERKSLRPSANTIGNAAIKALEHRNEANRLFSLLRVPENHPEWESKLNKIIKTRKY